MKNIREAAVSGTFYPDSCEEIGRYIAYFNEQMPTICANFIPRAIIVPHAGYIYSGYTANLAYHLCAKNRSDIKRIVVLGPSHRVYLKGVSVALYDGYKTPCKTLCIDKNFSQVLKDKFPFVGFFPEAHAEHSTETQFPFISHYFKDATVVELVYGDIAFEELSLLIDEILTDKSNLMVISTDLSHFHTEEEANKIDLFCVNAITNLNIPNLLKCEACGIKGVLAICKSSINHGFKTQFLDYRTSYARTKDASRVVGYTSFIIG